jgi:hypothetical protein
VLLKPGSKGSQVGGYELRAYIAASGEVGIEVFMDVEYWKYWIGRVSLKMRLDCTGVVLRVSDLIHYCA